VYFNDKAEKQHRNSVKNLNSVFYFVVMMSDVVCM